MIRAALIFDAVLLVIGICLPVASPSRHPLPRGTVAYDEDVLLPPAYPPGRP